MSWLVCPAPECFAERTTKEILARHVSQIHPAFFLVWEGLEILDNPRVTELGVWIDG
jgi:hypothetical protein